MHSWWICFCTQGLLEARQELRPLLSQSNDRLKDILFLDIALDSAVRTAVERGYEELNNASPEVSYKPYYCPLIITLPPPPPILFIII